GPTSRPRSRNRLSRPDRASLQGVFGVTGTPGTGKKSVATLVARDLGLEEISLDSVARRLGLVSPRGVVDQDRLKEGLMHERIRGAVLYGHLLPGVIGPKLLTGVVILRCEPSELKRRLRERGYPESKVIQNVEAELIGLVASEAHGAFGSSAFECDTTGRTAQESARTIVRRFKGGTRRTRTLDWLGRYDTAAKLSGLLSWASR
ncbi:MAG TPA: AAA family ATPase, partial [Nitrososphaerales archaeon]|nr:AAA family ATPase [Nitrososphaerales archaeon]